MRMLGRDPRFDVDIPVSCSTRNGPVAHRMTNISRGGFFVQGLDPLPMHDELEVAITLPGQDVTIRARGRVVRSQDPRHDASSGAGAGAAIRILKMSLADRAVLESYLLRLELDAVGRAN